MNSKYCFECRESIESTKHNFQLGSALLHPVCTTRIIQPLEEGLVPYSSPSFVFNFDTQLHYMEPPQDLFLILAKNLATKIGELKKEPSLKEQQILVVKFTYFKKLCRRIGGFTQHEIVKKMQSIYDMLYFSEGKVNLTNLISISSWFLFFCCQAKIPISMNTQSENKIYYF